MFDKYIANDITRVYFEKYAQLKKLWELTEQKDSVSEDDLYLNSWLNIYVEPTNRCNLSCAFCARENMDRDFDMLDFEVFKKFIDSLPKGTYITLTGNGEPTIHVGLYDMIRYASDSGMIVSIITNACVLNSENRKKLLDSGVSRIQMSFQSIDKESNEKLMCGCVFEKQSLNILNMIYEIQKSNKKIYTSIASVKTEINKKYADITRSFWKKLPINNYYEGELLSLQNDSKMFVVDTEEKKYLPCAIPWIALKVNANGDVSGCHQDFSNKLVLGNIKKDNILDIVNNEKSIKFRKALLLGDWDYLESIGYGGCRNCNTWQEKANYNIKGAMDSQLPIRLGLVIDELSNDKNGEVEFLAHVIKEMETGKTDIIKIYKEYYDD